MGIERSKKLVLASFSDYGRGVLTKTRIRTGEELINLPLNLTINVTTLLMDEEFCSIFEGSLLEYKHSVSFQNMINHSAKAQNETKLIVENKVKNVSLFALCEDAFSKC
ncbi:unnamed protein product [Leptosia nina]|uniref:Uncharacterized protein n=1 Tax=Leptosia nina TaxID=320188 RepID=A0AAV1JVU9_9NEOP